MTTREGISDRQERPLMQRLRNFDGFDVKQTYTEAADRIEQLEREQQWLAEVGPPQHPDDERHWAMAYMQERRRAERAEAALAEAKRDGERYRFWRKLWCQHDDCEAVNALAAEGFETEAEWDAAIDAAMQEPRDG